VNTCSFTHDGNRLLTGSDDTSIKLWDWRNGEEKIHVHTLHTGNVFQAQQMHRWCEDSVVSCAADGNVQLHSWLRPHSSIVLGFHTGRAHKLSLSPVDPCTFLSCGEDGKVLFFDVRDTQNGKLAVKFLNDRKRRVQINAVAHDPTDSSGNRFAVAGGDKKVRIYDLRTASFANSGNGRGVGGGGEGAAPHESHTRDDHNNPDPLQVLWDEEAIELGSHITSLAYSSQGELLVNYSEDNVFLLDPATGKSKQHYKGHCNRETVKGVAFFGPNDDFVVSGSDCGHVFIWSKGTGDLLQMLRGDEDICNCITPHPHLCTTLATSGLEHDCKVWQSTASESTVPDEEYMRHQLADNASSQSAVARAYTWMRAMTVDMLIDQPSLRQFVDGMATSEEAELWASSDDGSSFLSTSSSSATEDGFSDDDDVDQGNGAL